MTRPFLFLGGGLDGQQREMDIQQQYHAIIERVVDKDPFQDEDEDEDEEREEEEIDFLEAEVRRVTYIQKAFRHDGRDILFFAHESLTDAASDQIEAMLKRHGEIK